jgi:putative ABC transport system permease protein
MTWLTRLFSRRRLYSELSEEIRAHLDEKVEQLVASGTSRKDAEAAARRAFGNVTLMEEDSRAVWRWAAIEEVFMDVRFGARMLRKHPGFTAAAVVTLALGIAANSTIFTMVNGWMLRPPRIKDPGRVVAILMSDPTNRVYGWDQKPLSAVDFVAWREQSQSFDGMVASEMEAFALTGEGEPERVPGMRVSADYFSVLGVDAALGRTFVSGEDEVGRGQLAILSHGLWQRRFTSDSGIIGKAIRLDGASYNVIGIMPSHFRVGFDGAQLWTPLVLNPARLLPASSANGNLRVLARLKPDVNVETATVEVATLARRAERTHPGSTKGLGARAMVLQKYLADEFKLGTAIQMSAVLVLLLIACVNFAGLQFSRAAARQTEIAVRSALGASRFRLVRQLVVENLLIAGLGGALGLVLAWWGTAALRRSLGWSEYVSEMSSAISIDQTVVAYTIGISILAAIVFGLAPAFHQTAVNLHSTLKEGGGKGSQAGVRHRAQSVLAVAQVAMALALLTGAGLMTWGFLHKIYAGFGIDPKQVLTAHIPLANARYKDASDQAAFFQRVIEQLETVPGVVSAGGTTSLIIDGWSRDVTFSIKGQPVLRREARSKADYVSITPGFFETLRVPLLRGRSVGRHDNGQAPPVAMVNQSFVRRYFPNEEPLGKHIRFDTDDSDRAAWSEIVGVAGNIQAPSEDWEERPQVYEPYFQRPSSAMTLVVRTTSPPADFAPLLRRAVWDIDGEQPLIRVQTMERVIVNGRAAGVAVVSLLGTFAGLALTMAMVGVFGVMAYTVAQRTHEIGIRMALGAQRRDVLAMIARKGFVLGAIGVGIGLVLAIPLVLLPTGMAPGMPFGQRAGVAFVAGVLLWLVALLASYIPARRATRVDPTMALRSE